MTGASRAGILFPCVLTAIFLILGIVGVSSHEMWRDEYQAWLIAADSGSLGELLDNTRYEGHPLLWHLVLYAVTRATVDPLGMQVIHVLIAAALVFLMCRCGPFGKLWKILFAFGYFTFFEFALISREYALTVLLALAAAALFDRARKRLLAFSVVLFLLANSSIYGLMIALVLAGLAAWELLRGRAAGDEPMPSRALAVVALCIVLSGAAVSLLQIDPPADSDFPVSVDASFDLERLQNSLARLLFAYIPVPKLGPETFWNTSLLDGIPLIVRCAFSIALIVLFGIHFLKRGAAAVFYLAGTAGMLLFYYFTGLDYLRYIGHLFVVLVVAQWLLDSRAGSPEGRPPKPGWPSIAARSVFAVILAAQVLAGVYSYSRDLALPFSNLTAAGEYIVENGLDDRTIFGAVDYRVSPISAIVSKPIFFPQRGEKGMFIRWDDRRDWDVTSDGVMRKAVELASQRRQGLLMALSYTIVRTRGGRPVPVVEGRVARNITIRFIEKFADPCICEDQGIYLYRLEYESETR